MNKKMLFVYNARAGKGQIKGKLADILEVFAGAGYEITVKPTMQAGDARKWVEERSEEYDLVVCSGGDGTLDDTVTGMIESGRRTPIGYIPAGSTNDFGSSLQISKNMLEAAETAVNGKEYACDIGRFNDDIFVYVAAFGIFTEVSYETDQDMKNLLGHLAYLLEGMRHLTPIKTYPLKVTYGDQVIEDDFIFGMVTNSVYVGGFKNITGRNVTLDDGVFEVTLIKTPQNPMELNDIMLALITRTMDSKYMYCFSTAELTIEAKEPVAWTLDGENGGAHELVTIKNISKGIDIKVNS